MPADQSDSQTERITAKPRLIGLLQRIKDSRTLLMVHLADDNTRYTSALLELDLQNGTLVLDELTPASGNERVAELKRFHATARLAGGQVRFRANVQQIDEANGALRYVASLPDALTYEQRRNAFRARVPVGLVVPAVLTSDTETTYECEVLDISTFGVRLDTAGGAELAVDDGHHYACQINFPEGGSISGEVELRFVGEDPVTHRVHIGARFSNLLGPQRKAIERFVMYLQREIIRRSRG